MARFALRVYRLALLMTCVFGPALCAVDALAQNGLPRLIKGPHDRCRFGSWITSGRDIDGDGCHDIIVCDRTFAINEVVHGRVIVYSGRDSSELWRYIGRGEETPIRPVYLIAQFMHDFDGDRVDDVLLGQPFADQAAGRVDILSGADGSVLFSVEGTEGDRLGRYVASLGDVNGDNTPDFAFVSAWLKEGRVSVRSGRDGSELFSVGHWWPRALSTAGDVNGDRLDDLLVGTWHPSGAGGVAAYSGANGELLYHIDPPHPHDTLFGWAIDGGVDLTGDERPDFVVSGWESYPGRVYICDGISGEVARVLENFESGFLIGITVQIADVDNDAQPEVCVGHALANTVFDLSLIDPIFEAPRASTTTFFGGEYSLGDVNGDGWLDFLNRTGGQIAIKSGSPLMLSKIWGGAAHPRGDDDPLVLDVYSASPHRTIHLLASRRGVQQTYIPRYGLTIDLRPPMAVVGRTATDEDGFGQFELFLKPEISVGAIYFQALDLSNPTFGTITSAVLEISVYEPE